MITVKPPSRVRSIYADKVKIFLAGSIEMGAAEEWQNRIENIIVKLRPLLDTSAYVLFNPRRDDWDPSWEQKYENPQFHQQVEWELLALNECDWILMYFDPATKSPISLLELGLYADSGKMVVVCPEGFYRKGNVDIVCDQYRVVQKDSLEEACKYILNTESSKKHIYEG